MELMYLFSKVKLSSQYYSKLESSLTLRCCPGQAIMYRYGEGLCGRPRCCAWQNLCPWDPAWSAASMDTGIHGYRQMTSPGDRAVARSLERWNGGSMWCYLLNTRLAVSRCGVPFAVYYGD